MMLETLSIAVWDTDKRRGQSLKERVEMFSEREAVVYCGDPAINDHHDVFFLSFNEYGEPIIKTARSVRLTGEDVFLLLVCERGGDVTPFFRPLIRPNGVLFHPVQNTALRDVFYEIQAEVERLSQAGEIAAFVFKSEGVSYRLPFRDILFFEANNKKINIHTIGQEISYYDSIENLASMLPSSFVRCHRGYLVNTMQIEEMRSADMELRLAGGYRIPLSRSFKDSIKEALSK